MEEFLKSMIKEAGTLGKSYFRQGLKFDTKSHLGDLVSEADRNVSTFCIQKIREQFPEHSILSEEENEVINPGSEYLWMIDPIDGTRNFAVGVSFWCTMIAVFYRDELYMSAIYDAMSDQLFFAKKGEGATLNDMPINANSIDSLDHAYGFCVRGGTNKMHNDRYVAMTKKLADHPSAWFHNFGTILGACYIASGGADFYAVNCGFDYDYAAAALICREAGALVTDSDGNPWQRGRQDIVIANPKLHPKIIEMLNS